MIWLLSQCQLAVVRRDGDFSRHVVDVEIYPVVRFEAEQLHVHINDAHPRHVRPASLGTVSGAAKEHRDYGAQVAFFALPGA